MLHNPLVVDQSETPVAETNTLIDQSETPVAGQTNTLIDQSEPPVAETNTFIDQSQEPPVAGQTNTLRALDQSRHLSSAAERALVAALGRALVPVPPLSGFITGHILSALSLPFC